MDIPDRRRYGDGPGYSWLADIAGFHEFRTDNSIIFVDAWWPRHRFGVCACNFGSKLRRRPEAGRRPTAAAYSARSKTGLALKNGADPEAPLNGAAPADAVTSPIVGVAYLAPQPGDAPFVRIGDSVSEGQTLLIIEAMKVMNQIRAPRSGRVARIFIEDAAPVEYGAALMLIE